MSNTQKTILLNTEVDGYVSYTAPQTLSDAEKELARDNIGASNTKITLRTWTEEDINSLSNKE